MTGTSKDVSESYLQFTLQELYGEEAKLISVVSDSAAGASETSVADPDGLPAVDYGGVASVHDNTAVAAGWKTGRAEIQSVVLAKLSPGPEGVYEGGERVRMTIRAKAHGPLEKPILGFLIRDRLGQDLFGENTLSFTDRMPTGVQPDQIFAGVFEFRLPMLPNGQYAVMASVANGDGYENLQHHWMHDALIINVSSSKIRYGLVGIPFERVELQVTNE
jgi:lipopolysaccharide transport system ATP-binding protein